MAGLIKIPLDMEVGLDPGDVVLDGDPAAPPPKKGGTAPSLFSVDVTWGQTVAHVSHCWALVNWWIVKILDW